MRHICHLRHSKLLWSLICTFIAIPVIAHDLYLMPKAFRVKTGNSLQVAFHNGDDFPESQAAARIERLLEPLVFSQQGSVSLKNLRADHTVVLAEASITHPGNSIIAVHTKPNGIELDSQSFEKYLKHEGLNHVLNWRKENSESSQVGRERYSKYVKSIIQADYSSDFYRHAVGFPIEIFPDVNPYSLKVQDTLPVRVLFRGKPAEDLQIEMSWLSPDGKAQTKIAGRTDAQGRLTIPIHSAGVWKLHTVLMERCQDPSAADWESFWSSLTFEIQ